MNKKIKQIIACLVAVAVVVGGFVWYNDDSVWAGRPAASEVEDSTLLIGTHLIYMLTMTPQIYEIANDSAEKAGQMKTYYKSELDPGVWYDITEARTVYDFSSTQGKAVQNSVIDGLELTHHTKPDGKTYDLSTGKEVSPMSIVNVYDVYNLPELESLRTMHQSFQEMSKKDKATKTKQKMLEAVLYLEVQDDTTANYDKQVDAMDTYQQHLREQNKADAQVIIATDIQSALDSGRRENVYKKVFDKVQEQALEAGQTTEDQENVMSDMVDLMNGAQLEVEGSRVKYETSMLTQGTALEDKVKYDQSMSVANNAVNTNYPSADGAIQYLEDLENIDLKQVTNKSRELNVAQGLKGSFIGSYRGKLEQGQSADYNSAASAGDPQSVLNKLITQGIGEYTAYRIEVQNMIEAIFLRTDDGAKNAFLESCLSEASGLKSNIKSDAFAAAAASDVDKLTDFIRDLMTQVFKELNQSSEVQNLQAQLKKLQDKYQDALTANDFDSAVALENQIDSLREKIQNKNDDLAVDVNTLQQQAASLDAQISATSDPTKKEALIKQKTAIESEIAQKKSQMGNNEQNVTQTVGELTRKAVTEIEKGSLSDQSLNIIQSAIEGLTGYMGDYAYAAYPAMEKIQKAFEASIAQNGPLDNALQPLYAAANEAVENFKELYENGPVAQPTADDANSMVDDYFAAADSAASGTQSKDKQEAIAASALDLLYRYPDGSAKIEIPSQGGSGAAGAGAGGSGTSGTGASGAGTSGAGASGAGTSGTGASGAGASGTGASGAGASGAGASGAGASGAGNGAVVIGGVSTAGGSGDILSAVGQMLSGDNPIIYSSLYKFGKYYAPVPTITNYTPYRIVTDQNGEVQILARGPEFYKFTHNLYQVEKSKAIQILTAPILKYGDIYVDGNYLSDEFGLYIVNLSSVGRSILADEDMINQINELYSLMVI